VEVPVGGFLFCLFSSISYLCHTVQLGHDDGAPHVRDVAGQDAFGCLYRATQGRTDAMERGGGGPRPQGRELGAAWAATTEL